MKKINYQKLKQLLPRVKRNILLKNYTTFKIGGPAKYFFMAKNKDDIVKTVKIAKKLKIPFLILGKGSNLLVSDKGFKGLVIKIQNTKYQIPRTRTPKENKFPTGRASSVRGKQNTVIHAEAGVPLSILVKKTSQIGLSGLEWAAGIPGTLGGAIRGNAGAFGREVKDMISGVEFLDEKGNKRKISKKQCHFSYRYSIFKKKNWIILSAILKLKKGNKKNIQKIVKEHIRYRKERQPLEYPSAGSIFKNIDLKKIPKEKRANFSQVTKRDPFPILPAAYLISKARLKGLRVRQAQVSEKHPNFIVNLGQAKSKDVIKLINLIKKRVKNKFGIELEEEIVILNEVKKNNPAL